MIDLKKARKYFKEYTDSFKNQDLKGFNLKIPIIISILKKARGERFPLNWTNNFVGLFDGRNDGLVGEKSFPLDDNFTLIEPLHNRGISHGDVIDLNRENIKGYDVREFYVKLVHDLKNRGF